MRAATTLALAALAFLATSLSAKEPVPSVQEPLVEPAVSALNGKIDGHYGRIADTYSRGLSGSLSVPVGIEFGAQLDGLYAHANEDDFYGLGAHFFTRNPSKGLLGVVASGLYSGAIESYLAALEAECYYFDFLTLGALVGYNNVDTDVLVPTFNPDLAFRDDYIFAHIYASLYPMDDLMVRFDYRHIINRNLYGVTVEYQLPVPGLAVYGSFALGDNDYRHALGGIRYYFGARKSLKLRHRQDDPPNAPGEQLFGGIAGAGSPGIGAPGGEFPSPE
jgi:hypothetical protein